MSQKTGYGVIYSKELEAGDYQLVVMNYGNKSIEDEFTVSTYSEDGIEIKEEKKSLEAVLTRA